MFEALRQRLMELTLLEESAHEIALTFSLGIFIAFSPLIGLHTLIGIFLAYVLRLNRFVMLSAVFVNNPWSMVPIYAFCTWVGMLVVGSEDIGMDLMGVMGGLSLSNALEVTEALIVPFVVGTLGVGVIISALSYYMVKAMVHRGRAARRGETGR